MPPKRKRGGATPATSKVSKKAKIFPITQLAPELLGLVFEHLHPLTMEALENTPERRAAPGNYYRDSRRHITANYGGPGHCDWYERNPNMMKQLRESNDPPEVFKFNYHLHELRRVSKQWKALIEAAPHFHSRIVHALDEDDSSSSLDNLQAQLGKTRDVPLDILVLRRNEEIEGNSDDHSEAEEEKRTARLVMSVLSPFIHRCRSFVFRTMYLSSLPLLSRDFRGDALQLRRLVLTCAVSNNPDDHFNSNVFDLSGTDYKFVCPNITTLIMDGNTFMDACLTPTWKSQLEQMRLDTLSIYRLTPPEVGSVDSRYRGFDQLEFIKALYKVKFVRYLRLEGVNMEFDPGAAAESPMELAVDSLELIEMDSEYVEEFIGGIYGSPPYCFYHLSGSSISWEAMPRVHHLRLENIDDIGSAAFNHALSRHGGDRLDIFACPWLEDAHLLDIASHCEFLRRLYILDCPKVTAKGLKAMVQRRIDLIEQRGAFDDSDSEDEDGDQAFFEVLEADDDAVDEKWEECGLSGYGNLASSYKPFREVVVCDKEVSLSKSDRKWFKERVDRFEWKKMPSL